MLLLLWSLPCPMLQAVSVPGACLGTLQISPALPSSLPPFHGKTGEGEVEKEQGREEKSVGCQARLPTQMLPGTMGRSTSGAPPVPQAAGKPAERRGKWWGGSHWLGVGWGRNEGLDAWFLDLAFLLPVPAFPTSYSSPLLPHCLPPPLLPLHLSTCFCFSHCLLPCCHSSAETVQGSI